MPAEANVAVRTLFAPFDSTAEEYLRFVSAARHSIHIIIYGLHLPALTDLLIAKHQAGVRVGLILDHTQAAGRAEAGEVARLVAAGVPLVIGTSPVHGQILHTKATIVDEVDVESGSWNYSLSASQQSNTLTFVHDAEYARAYLDHWHRIRGFVTLHDMLYQPAGAVTPDDVPAADILPASPTDAPTDAPPSAPAATPSSPVAGSPAWVSGAPMQTGGAPAPVPAVSAASRAAVAATATSAARTPRRRAAARTTRRRATA